VNFTNGGPAPGESRNKLFTVGHSNLPFREFVALLKDHGIELVADVRSVPEGARLKHFRAPAIEKLLRAEHLAYLFAG